VPLEGLAGAEVAGQRAEADLEALLAVDEAGDGLAGAGGVALGEGLGDLAQILDGVRDVEAELVQPVLAHQHAVAGEGLLERDAVEHPVETGRLDGLRVDALEVLELAEERLDIPEQAGGHAAADRGVR